MTGIFAVMKRLSSPAFSVSSVTSVRGLALNLISTLVFGMRVNPRYCGSRVRSSGRGAALLLVAEGRAVRDGARFTRARRARRPS